MILLFDVLLVLFDVLLYISVNGQLNATTQISAAKGAELSMKKLMCCLSFCNT